MDLERVKKIRDLEVEAITLRNPMDLAETSSELTREERWNALNDRIKPYLKDEYDPNRKDSQRKTGIVRSTNKIEVSPADETNLALCLQISVDPVGPYIRATYSSGELPGGSGYLPGVPSRIEPIIEPFSPAMFSNDFDESLALALLKAIEQSVDTFCEASRAQAE